MPVESNCDGGNVAYLTDGDFSTRFEQSVASACYVRIDLGVEQAVQSILTTQNANTD